MDNKKQLIIDIQIKTVLKIVLVFLILGFLYLIRGVLIIFLIAIILSSIIIPIVDYLKKKKIPKTASTIGIYLIFIFIIALAIYLVIPIVANQITVVAHRINTFFNTSFSNFLGSLGFQSKDITGYFQKGIESFSGSISSFSLNIYNLTIRVVGSIATAVMILVLAFYLTLEEDSPKKITRLFLHPSKQKQIVKIIYKAQRKMGLWLGGQLIMCLLVFILSFIVFLVFRLDSAFTLALIMGILEIIPYFGPIIGGTAAALVAFSQSFWLGIAVIIAIILIQQLENHVLIPNVMKKVTGLSPVVIILAILIGIELFGFIGMVIAIPIAVGIQVILQESFSVSEKGVTYKKDNLRS